MPFYLGVWGIRIGVEVQFCSISLDSASRIPASSTSFSITASICSRGHRFLPQVLHARHTPGLGRIDTDVGSAYPMLDHSSFSSLYHHLWGQYPKPYLDPLTSTRIGSIIPWKFLPDLKPCSKPFCSITVAIILYMAGMVVCGVKSSPVVFTSSTV